jgi:hypothetical protein
MRLGLHGGRLMLLSERDELVWSGVVTECEYRPRRWNERRLRGRGTSRVAFESLALDAGTC